MKLEQSTCWEIIDGARSGDRGAREEFARRYEEVIRMFLAGRWRLPLGHEAIDEAAQDVFLEIFAQGGFLTRVGQGEFRFRQVLYGVVRNVARRSEVLRKRRMQGRRISDVAGGPEIQWDGDQPEAFDQAWARACVRKTLRSYDEVSKGRGALPYSRSKLLELRFFENLPNREIARRWEVDRDLLRREYAEARREFREELRRVVSRDFPEATAVECEEECRQMLRVLSQD